MFTNSLLRNMSDNKYNKFNLEDIAELNLTNIQKERPSASKLKKQ